MEKMFERASKAAIRFSSIKGEITVEQLWNLPLMSRDNFDLNTVAKTVNTQLKSISEESFVNVVANPAQSELELKLEIVKYIIADVIAEKTARADKIAKATERQKLLSVLEQKEDSALSNLSVDELRKKIQELA